MTTVVLVGNTITQQRVGETLYGVETHTDMQRYMQINTLIQSSSVPSSRHMNTNTHRGWTDCCEDGKMDVESHAEKLTRNTFQWGRRTCLHWLLTNACSSHVAARPKKPPVLYLTCSRVDLKCHKLDFVRRRPLTRPLRSGQRCGL